MKLFFIISLFLSSAGCWAGTLLTVTQGDAVAEFTCSEAQPCNVTMKDLEATPVIHEPFGGDSVETSTAEEDTIDTRLLERENERVAARAELDAREEEEEKEK